MLILNGLIFQSIIIRKILEEANYLYNLCNKNCKESKDINLIDKIKDNLNCFENFLNNNKEDFVILEKENNDNSISYNYFILDIKKIKEEFIKFKNTNLICSILESLRWRITRAHNPILRRESVLNFVTKDIFEKKIVDILLKKNILVAEYTLSLINSLSSEYMGRDYLMNNNDLISKLIKILKNEDKDTFLRKNAWGTLQKLSLRIKVQKKLIEEDLIKLITEILKNELNSLSTYSLEYLTAFLMNLSLTDIGKKKCDDVKEILLKLLINLCVSKNSQVIIFANGTLYSLFSRENIRNYALKNKYDEIFLELINNKSCEENLKKYYSHILVQLKNTNKNTEDTNYEEEEDNDLLDEEIFEEEAEIPLEKIKYNKKGEDLLIEYILDSKEAKKEMKYYEKRIEEVNSKLEITGLKRQNSFNLDTSIYSSLRPKTPIKIIEKKLNNDIINNPEFSKEFDYAFKSRPKILK